MKYDIEQHNACDGAVKYYDTKTSFEKAWSDCPRGDWMLWIAYKLQVEKRVLTLAKARCAKTVIHLMNDERSKKAIEVAEQYGIGVSNIDELKNASASSSAAYASASYDAAYAAACYDASYDAASAAAYAAAASASASAASASAAYAAAAYAASASAYAASASASALKKNELGTANICREILTEAVFKKIK